MDSLLEKLDFSSPVILLNISFGGKTILPGAECTVKLDALKPPIIVDFTSFPMVQLMYIEKRGEDMRGGVAAYFDLDGTLLDASSEKTLTAVLGIKRPWRIPYGAAAWTVGFLFNLLRLRAPYDAARNRGHFSLASWEVLETLSQDIAKEKLASKITKQARDKLDWHRDQGHRLVLVTATIAPMAEAMAEVLGMDAVYGCGPANRSGVLSGSESGWSVPRRKGKVPIVKQDAEENGHDLEQCYGYGNTMADSWFMRITGNPVAINSKGSFKQFAKEHNWEMHDWKIQS